MGKKSRDKGAAGERELVRLLKGYGLNARRTAQMQSQDAAYMPDVYVEEWPDIWIECKREKRCSPRRAYLQGYRETANSKQRVLAITRSDRQQWMVYGLAGTIIQSVSPRGWYQSIDLPNLQIHHWYQKLVVELSSDPRRIPVLLSPHPDGVSTAKMAYMTLDHMMQTSGWEETCYGKETKSS